MDFYCPNNFVIVQLSGNWLVANFISWNRENHVEQTGLGIIQFANYEKQGFNQ